MTIGDVVRSKKTGIFYTVTGLVGNHWFTHNQSTSPKLKENFELVSQKWNNGCEHHWVDVGFRFSKTVCKHCDMEK